MTWGGAPYDQEGLLKEHPSTPDIAWPRLCSVLAALVTLGCALGSVMSQEWLSSYPTSDPLGTNYTWGLMGYCYHSGLENATHCYTGYGTSFSAWPGIVWQLTIAMVLLACACTAIAALAGLAAMCKVCRRPDWHGSVFAGCASIAFVAAVFMFPAGFGSTVHAEHAMGVRVCVFGDVYSLGGGCGLEWGYKLLLLTTCLSALTLALYLAADKMVLIRSEMRRYVLLQQQSAGHSTARDARSRRHEDTETWEPSHVPMHPINNYNYDRRDD
eukprot:comp19393_c0_seq1/m.22415 comp19393_c0_seq1/g.22415  ORF comp19393_c0_seq1/g.22415 comp19393_c0_seq1/m.22415 type:complete len:271 (-) comp19393_c0_seq1:579-1391(-)